MNIIDLLSIAGDLIGVVTDLHELSSSSDITPGVFIFFPIVAYTSPKDKKK